MPTPVDTSPSAAWKQRYRVPTTWVQLAKSRPTRGLAVSNRSGVYQLYAWDVESNQLHQLTERPTGVVFGTISPDGEWIYYLHDQSGNEIGHWVRRPFGGGARQDITPDLPPYASLNFSVSRSSTLLGLTIADQHGFQVYVVPRESDAALGESRPIFHSRELLDGPALSYDGEVAVLATVAGGTGLNFRMLAFDTATGEQIGALSDGSDVSVELGTFSPLPGDLRLLATTDRSGAKRPLLWNVRSGERSDLPLDDIPGELRPLDWSADGAYILLMQFHHAIHQLYVFDLASGTARRLEHPAGSLGGAFFGPGNEIFIHWQDSTHPLQLLALDGTTGAVRRTVMAAAAVPPSRPWRSITVRSSDGTPIQGWLAVPEGSGPFPLILETHGGPTAVATETFSAGAQAWLDHGYAFCTVNYRGSISFGRDFEQQIWGDLGNYEVADMVAVRSWLVAQGIADPKQILLTGWSYGGYLTLMALGKEPELWAGGMAGVAIADWAIQYEDTADTLKGYQVALLGGTPEEQAELYAACSPITYVERVAAPVLVIQGSNDTRCPARPMRMYEARMRQLGKPFQIHWFEAGHGSYVVDQAIEHQQLMLEWAARVLDSQASGTL